MNGEGSLPAFIHSAPIAFGPWILCAETATRSGPFEISSRPSHVLRALGLNYRAARSSIRLGFGRYTTQQELVDACHRLAKAAVAQEKLDA